MPLIFHEHYLRFSDFPFHLRGYPKFKNQNHEISLTLIWKSLSSVLQDLTPILTKILTSSDPYKSWSLITHNECNLYLPYEYLIVAHQVFINKKCTHWYCIPGQSSCCDTDICPAPQSSPRGGSSPGGTGEGLGCGSRTWGPSNRCRRGKFRSQGGTRRDPNNPGPDSHLKNWEWKWENFNLWTLQ